MLTKWDICDLNLFSSSSDWSPSASGCASSFSCLFKFSFHSLAIVRNILNASKLAHCSLSNGRTYKYMSGLISKNCHWRMPVFPPHVSYHTSCNCCHLMSLNLQHCPLRYASCCNTFENIENKQTNWLFYSRRKGFFGRKGLLWRRALLSLSASAELRTGIFHGWKTLQRWEIPTGARSWKSNILNSI